MIALSRIGHLDFSGQNRSISVTLVQPEVVALRGAADVVFNGRAAEWQVWPAVEKFRNPAGDFRGKGAFVDWHISEPEFVNQMSGEVG